MTHGGRSTVLELFEELAARKDASSIEMATAEQVADYLGSLLLLLRQDNLHT